MKDINTRMQTLYFNALQALSVNVYDSFIPPDKNDTFYILFQGVQNSDSSTKQTDDTLTYVKLDIIQKFDGNVSKVKINQAAGQIFALTDKLGYDNEVQIFKQKLENDNTITATDGTKKILIRTLTFSHRIFHR